MAYVTSEIEFQCIQAAQVAHIKCIREQLENLQFSVSDGWSLLDGFEWQWQASFAGKLEQAILVPVVFLLIVPLCAAFSFQKPV